MDEKELMNQTEETFENTADDSIAKTTIITDDIDSDNETAVDEFVYEEIQDDFVYSETDEESPEIYNDQKKGFIIQKPIFIACCILLCTIIAFGGFTVYTKLFGSNNFIGTWVHQKEASADEATKGHEGNGVTYFTFENGGKATMTMGTMTITGEWAYNSDDNSKIDVSIYYYFGGTFSVDVQGNVFTGKTLNLKDSYGSTYDFKSTTIPKMYTEKKENTKIDDKILGTWSNEEKAISYVFRADGTYTLDEGGIISIDGVYYTKGNKIITTYISNEATETNYEYKVNKNGTVTIAGLEFTKQK